MADAAGRLTPETVKYLAFEGGGAMGVGYLGALVALEEMCVTPCTGSTQIEGVSGTSIGAVVAMMVGMGCSAKDINARLVRDRVFRALHAEPIRAGRARKFTYPHGSATVSPPSHQTGKMDVTEPDLDPIVQIVEIVFDNSLSPKEKVSKIKKGISRAIVSELEGFLGDWLSGTITSVLGDNRIFSEYIYEGAARALRGSHADIIRGNMFFIDYVRSKFDAELGDNQFFTTQFNEWVSGDPFREGVFADPKDRERYAYYTLGAAAFVVVTLFASSLVWGGEEKDMSRNKLQLLMIVAQNYAFNAAQPWMVRDLRNLAAQIGRLITAAQLDVGTAELRGIFEELEDRICRLVKRILFSAHFQELQDQIVTDGALFSGVVVRAILAETIYAHVEVDKNGSFKKRETPIAWSNENVRDYHPALSSKAEQQIRSEYDRLHRVLDERGSTSPGPYRRLRELKKEVAKFDELDEERRRQIKTIMKKFTIEDYAQIFGVELCVTGTNITTGRTCYFNRYLTPAMPVVDAVGISSSFPFLFKPTRLKYTGSKWSQHSYCADDIRENIADLPQLEAAPKDLSDWYRANYHGWFIDGGLLNNIPIHAFNGHAEHKRRERALDPVNMRFEPLNPHVLALVLDKLDHSNSKGPRHSWKKKVDAFDKSKGPPPLISQLMAILYETPGVHATYSSLPAKAFKRKQVVFLDVPGVSLFDIVPVETSLRETDWTGYEAMCAHFGLAAGARDYSTKDAFKKYFARNNKAGRKWRRKPSRIGQRRLSNEISRRTGRWR